MGSINNGTSNPGLSFFRRVSRGSRTSIKRSAERGNGTHHALVGGLHQSWADYEIAREPTGAGSTASIARARSGMTHVESPIALLQRAFLSGFGRGENSKKVPYTHSQATFFSLASKHAVVLPTYLRHWSAPQPLFYFSQSSTVPDFDQHQHQLIKPNKPNTQ